MKPSHLIIVFLTLLTVISCESPAPSYIITFNANGGSGFMDSQIITAGQSAPLKMNSFTRTGATFTGWAISPTGSAIFADGDMYNMGTADVSLYAVWSFNSYSITFDPNGGSGTMSKQIITSGTSANLLLSSFTRAGYTFAGWATSAKSSVAYTDGSLYTMGYSDITLYAVWETNYYTISFDPNGGSGSMANQTLPFGRSTYLYINTFIRSGYTFAGWATSDSEGVVYANNTIYTMGAQDVTLYAVWVANGSVTITFEWSKYQTLSFSSDAVTVTVGTTLTINPSFTEEGSNWQWYINNVLDNAQTSSSFCYTPSMAGTDVISVMAVYNNIGYSGSVIVTVTP